MNKLRHSLLLFGVLLATCGNAQELGNNHWSTLKQYCSKCHNTDDFSGGFAIEQLDPGDLHTDAALWEKVVRKLRSGMMPPPGQDRPAVADIIREILIDNHDIAALVLGAAEEGAPGPLVTHFAGVDAGRLPVPVMIVPGGLSVEQLDRLS